MLYRIETQSFYLRQYLGKQPFFYRNLSHLECEINDKAFSHIIIQYYDITQLLIGKYGWDSLKELFLLSTFEDDKILEHFD